MAGGDSRVVVVGGGYGGLMVAIGLEASTGCEVTLVSSSEVFLHKVAGLRAAVTEGWDERIMIPYAGVKNVVHATVTKINYSADGECSVELDNGKTLPFDRLVLATGSMSSDTAGNAGKATDKEGIRKAYAEMRGMTGAATKVLIIGGGPIGIEMAGEIKAKTPDKDVTLVTSKDLMESPLAPFREALKTSLKKKMEAKGIKVHVNVGRVEFDKSKVNDYGFIQGSNSYSWEGGEMEADLCIICIGASDPSPLYKDSGLEAWVDERGFLKVENTLEVEGTAGTVFAVGDCNNAPLPKLAYLAGETAKSLVKNVNLSIKGSPLKNIVPAAQPFTLVPLGPNGGAAQLKYPVLGDFFVRMAKAKDLFCAKFWADYKGGTAPPVGDGTATK